MREEFDLQGQDFTTRGKRLTEMVEALRALEETRAEGATAGLVVLATGLGKTWLSAFDSHRPEFRRILFVAHREEILTQSRATFAHALRDRCSEGGMVLFNTVEYDRASAARCDRILFNLQKAFLTVMEFKFEGVNRVFVAQ